MLQVATMTVEEVAGEVEVVAAVIMTDTAEMLGGMSFSSAQIISSANIILVILRNRPITDGVPTRAMPNLQMNKLERALQKPTRRKP